MSTSRKLITALIISPFFLSLIVYLIYKEETAQRPDQLAITTAGHVEMCLNCHTTEKLDPAHDGKVVGCSPCHLGNPLATDKEAAHVGMVLNPGDLRVAEKTCGVAGCHPADIQKVKNSLMATNRGIIATLLYYWGETDTHYTDLTVEKLLESGETSLALDYYRKLCATCHLWKQKDDLPGASVFFNQKGGGCSACHAVYAEEDRVPYPGSSIFTMKPEPVIDEHGNKQIIHPQIIKEVPTELCLRCHNRSGRIGISYIGVFESEGYGTPYEKGVLSGNRLPGDRFYIELDEDIHHRRGMDCIDCHTRDEIMGDGTSYVHYEEQMEISCAGCHGENPGMTRKGKRLTNIKQDEQGRNIMVGKISGKEYLLTPTSKEHCENPLHQRLSCDACHSSWVPQCYGCHVKRDARETHLDKLTLEETEGWWEEGRSFIRYNKPMLAIWDDEVVVVTPGCQDIVTLIDKDGEIEGGFNRLTMAAITPHTTQPKGRDCVDCHQSPKTIGLGEGTVVKKDGEWLFYPVHQGVETLFGTTVGLDNYVTIDGEPLQLSARTNLRSFNKEELHRILRVGLCLQCHDKGYNDPAFKNYDRERQCPVYKEP